MMMLIQDEYLKSGATFILDDLVFKSNDDSVACGYIRVSQWVKQFFALPLLWHGSTPTDENPAGHEEDLAPAVHEHLFVGVGSSAVLHRVVTSSAVREDRFLSQDNEDCSRKREAQGPPSPMGADDDGKSQEEHYKWNRKHAFSLHVAGIKV